jgi:hypothetical protein
MRIVLVSLCLISAVPRMFGQAATGTFTGTVADPTGAVVASVGVEARNSETGVVYQAATTATGNYTITQLPVGTYEVLVKAPGFKTYSHANLAMPAGATIREDVTLEVGAATEAVTVTGQASLLSTESAEAAHNVTLGQLDNLPLLGIGAANAGTAGIRNPFALTQLLPGTTFGSPTGAGASNTVIVNGLPNNSEGVRIEGQDSRNNTPGVSATAVRQPSADAVQEVSVQTSNYAPELGSAGGGVYNIIMKSGTNSFHGSGYEYFVNEDLNAAGSFSQSSSGGKYRPRNRRNDYGTTLGGPVWIPKLYNGRDRTFFFFSWEQYRESNLLTFNDTVPTDAYRNGDFSAISPNGTCSLCAQYGIQQSALGVPTAISDPLGRPIFANEIFDPLSRSVNPANNLGYANSFPNNMVPASRFSPTAVAMQKLFPEPNNSNLTQNYIGDVPSQRITTIPSLKIDESFGPKNKFAFYYSTTGTASAVSTPLGNADGLPLEIGEYRGTYIDTKTIRLNYDRTMKPTLLLHLGAGWQRVRFDDHAPFTGFDPSVFGLSGFKIHRQFPSVTGMCAGGSSPTLPCTGAGGMQYIGTSNQGQTLTFFEKPTYNANLTWVHGNHAIKAGGEASQMGAVTQPFAGVTLATGTGPTSQPFTPTNSLNGYSMGFGYASFLLGDFTSTAQTPLEDYRQGHMAWAWFLQDSWKVSHKLTLTYGIRYDISTPVEEEHGRVGQFDPNTPNPNAGGHPGAVKFANTCNCSFYQSTYPWAFGPRWGVAYQIDAKTVLRGGWGFVYQFPTDDGIPTIGSSAVNAPTGINAFVNINTPNAVLQPVWPVTNPYVYPAPGVAIGATGNIPFAPDRNFNRPPRQNQWSIGVQREVTRNLLIEAAYVANRDVWLNGSTATASNPQDGSPGFLSQLSPAVFAKFALYPYPGTGPAGYTLPQNYADYQLLTQPINSTAVISRMQAAGAGVNGLVLPYNGFPVTNSLLSALYPYPQFGNLTIAESPTGRSKYDSLQMKLTKRFSHGLQAAGAFTWQKGFVGANRQNYFDPMSSVWDLMQIPPFQLTINATYVTPAIPFGNNRFLNVLTKDWQIGMFAVYQSAPFLAPPSNTISNFLTNEEYRVPGQPLFLVDVNDHSKINPYTQQVLNPNAWAPVPAGGAGPALGTLYGDFRGPRRPVENANFGRNFRVKEKYNLQVRAEFTNIFNRTYLPQPITSVAPQLPLTRNGLGQYTNGFGVMNATAAVNTVPTLNGASRAGTLIARFTF